MSLQIQKPMNYLNFIMICFILRLRDLFFPVKYVLKDIEIKPNSTILDFGCGPGSYSIAAAELLDGTGNVFSIDIHPHALQKVRKTSEKKGLKNIKTIVSDCDTGLPLSSVDIVLLYYVFNDLENSDRVLQELYRVLKPQGILSLSEFNVKKISSKLEKTKLFKLQKENELTHTFIKIS